MQRARLSICGLVRASLIIALGGATEARAQSGPPPECTGWNDCIRGRSVCTNDRLPPYFGSTIISDAVGGLSSDGRGPYVTDIDGVRYSFVVLGHMNLALTEAASAGVARSLTLDLSAPVAGSGAVALGRIAIRGGSNSLYTAWERVGDHQRSLLHIPVGKTVQAAQINVSFHLDGRFHVLQMGPQALGHCHQNGTRVHGAGTSSGTIHRASPSRWVVDLPAGSVGRLFDASRTVEHAVDKGLFRVRLRYELVDAVPGVITLLAGLAQTEGGDAVVARYRALKRDSAQAYYFGDGQLHSAGFILLGANKPQDAIRVFRLSVEEHPGSSSSHAGLGEAYLVARDTSNAIASYRRSLELDPKNQGAADVLKRLQVTP